MDAEAAVATEPPWSAPTPPPLGRAREPAVVVLLVALTLGGYFVVWVHRTLREARAHGGLIVPPSPGLGAALALVPIANLWVFAGLARAVSTLEEQHGDPRTNPSLLFVLFALPVLWPLAIWGAQDALNRHWANHVRSTDGWGDDDGVGDALG